MTIDTPKTSHAPALRALFKEAFSENDAFLDDFFELGFSTDRALAVFEHGEPVSAIYWFDVEYSGGVAAYLYALGTKREARGRGLARTLMDKLHVILRERGYSAAIIVPATPALFEYYRGIGYIDASGISEQMYTADGSTLPLTRLDTSEYLSMRRKILPTGGVIEEGAIAELLSRGAEFYTGEGFLLAARRERDRLFGIELLGDKSRAPSILTALGYSEGIFRFVGEDRPFAMYIPLTDSAKAPGHFGIALDI